MITGPQIRAARALLGWSAQELAQRSGVSYPTIQRAESATGVPSMNATNMEKLEVVFNGAGIVFERRNGVLWVGMAPP